MKVNTWFERDRKHIELCDDDEKTILEFWDEEVDEVIEDGFVDMRNLEASMIEYAKHLSLI